MADFLREHPQFEPRARATAMAQPPAKVSTSGSLDRIATILEDLVLVQSDQVRKVKLKYFCSKTNVRQSVSNLLASAPPSARSVAEHD